MIITLGRFKNSITKKGFYEPILIWKKNGWVLAGNHRTIAARELVKEGYVFKTPKGDNHLPVVIEDCDDARAEEILHDTNNHYASWIDEKLSEALTAAEEAGKDLRDYGYTTEQVDEILESAIEEAEGTDSSEEEDEPKDVKKAVLPDEFETISLPKDVHDQFMDVLRIIAKSINEGWQEGDSISEAVQALCQLLYQSGALTGFTEGEAK